MIDNQGNWAADGIVGPHFEKEGSYYSIKEIWSPVIVLEKSIDRNFNGSFTVENRYDFLNLNTCKFVWKQVKFSAQSDAKGMNKIIKQGEVEGSDMAAKTSGKLNLDTKIDPQADALFLTAIDHRAYRDW